MLVPLVCAAALAQEAPPPPPASTVRPPAAGVEPQQPVPFRFSLLPGVGYNADPNLSVDGTSLGVVSRAAELRGFEAELGASWVDGRVDGLQSSLGANIAGSVDGMQATLGFNWSKGDVRWGQLSMAANTAEGDVDGIQATTGVNIAVGNVRGVQMGGVNVALGIESRALQASMGVNVARDLQGVQAAPLNLAEEVEGVQLGLLNVGGDVKGLQLGLVNVARTSGVSIAPINLIGDGLHRLDIWTADNAVGTAAIKFGSKHMYTMLGAGLVNTHQPWWTFGGGMGLHLPRERLWLEIDDSVWALAQGIVLAPGVHNKLRASLGIDLHDHIAPFAGVSMNTWVGTGTVYPRPSGPPTAYSEHHRFVAWPGVHAGVSF